MRTTVNFVDGGVMVLKGREAYQDIRMTLMARVPYIEIEQDGESIVIVLANVTHVHLVADERDD